MAESVHLVSAHLHRSASDREAPGLLKDFREQICHILVRKDFRYIENFASDLFDRNVVCTVTKDFVAAAAATYTSSRGTISSDSEVVVNTLLDRVKLEFEVHPEKLESFLEAVKAVGVLSTIYERMITLTDRDRLEANTVSSAGDKCTAPVEKDHDLSRLSLQAARLMHKSKISVKSLQSEFKSLLKCKPQKPDEDIIRNLQTRLSWYMNNAPAFEDIVIEIHESTDHETIFDCLVSHNLIGYFNCQLLHVFQECVPSLKKSIEEYEAKHKEIFESMNFDSLAQIFNEDPMLAPKLLSRLPQFTIHFTDSKAMAGNCNTVFQLKKKFQQQLIKYWPDYMQVAKFDKKDLVIAVLPIYAEVVVTDLSKERIMKEFKSQGIMIDLSEMWKYVNRPVSDSSSADRSSDITSSSYSATDVCQESTTKYLEQEMVVNEDYEKEIKSLKIEIEIRDKKINELCKRITELEKNSQTNDEKAQKEIKQLQDQIIQLEKEKEAELAKAINKSEKKDIQELLVAYIKSQEEYKNTISQQLDVVVKSQQKFQEFVMDFLRNIVDGRSNTTPPPINRSSTISRINPIRQQELPIINNETSRGTLVHRHPSMPAGHPRPTTFRRRHSAEFYTSTTNKKF